MLLFFLSLILTLTFFTKNIYSSSYDVLKLFDSEKDAYNFLIEPLEASDWDKFYQNLEQNFSGSIDLDQFVKIFDALFAQKEVSSVSLIQHLDYGDSLDIKLYFVRTKNNNIGYIRIHLIKLEGGFGIKNIKANSNLDELIK